MIIFEVLSSSRVFAFYACCIHPIPKNNKTHPTIKDNFLIKYLLKIIDFLADGSCRYQDKIYCQVSMKKH